MNIETTIHCPDSIRGGAHPWAGTLAELVRADYDAFARLLADLEDRGVIPALDDEDDDERCLADVAHLLTVHDVRQLADDPNAEVIDPMTNAELRVVREFLGLTGEWLASRLGVQDRTWRRWEAGTSPIPDGVRVEVELLEAETARVVGHLVERVGEQADPELVTYRSDEQAREVLPGGEFFPASWHRAVAARVAQEVPGLVIRYAD